MNLQWLIPRTCQITFADPHCQAQRGEGPIARNGKAECRSSLNCCRILKGSNDRVSFEPHFFGSQMRVSFEPHFVLGLVTFVYCFLGECRLNLIFQSLILQRGIWRNAFGPNRSRNRFGERSAGKVDPRTDLGEMHVGQIVPMTDLGCCLLVPTGWGGRLSSHGTLPDDAPPRPHCSQTGRNPQAIPNPSFVPLGIKIKQITTIGK